MRYLKGFDNHDLVFVSTVNSFNLGSIGTRIVIIEQFFAIQQRCVVLHYGFTG